MSFSVKPANPELLSTNTFYNNQRCFVPLVNQPGPPIDIVTNTIAQPLYSDLSTNPTVAWSSWVAGVPEIQSNVFPYSITPDSALRVFPNGPSMQFGSNSGYASGSAPTARTIFITFKINGANSGGSTSSRVALAAMGGQYSDTVLTLIPVGSANPTAFQVKLHYGASSDIAPPSPMYCYSNIWYTIAISIDDSGGSANQIIDWWLYDWSTNTTYHYTSTGLTITWYYSSSATYATLCPPAGNSFYSGFDGWIYCFGIYSGAWNSSNNLFSTYISDPLQVARGSYISNGSAVTAGKINIWKRTTTSIDLGSSRPGNGNGTVTYQWHRSATPNFTPGSGTVISGATTRNYTDVPGSIGPWFYKLVYTDAAANTATSNQCHTCLDENNPVSVSLIGDSITDNAGSGLFYRINAISKSSVRGTNFGVQGSTVLGTWQPQNYYLYITGNVTGGTFNLNVNGTNTTNLAYNATAATVQSAIVATNAATLTGNVTCSGTLSNGMTIVFPRSSLPWYYSWGTVSIGSNSLAVTDVNQNYSIYCNSYIRLVASKIISDGCNLVTVMLGANDAAATSSTGNYQTDLLNLVNYLNSVGIKVILHYPTYRSDNDSTGALVYGYSSGVDYVVNSINNPNLCVLGDTLGRQMSVRYFDNTVIGYGGGMGQLHPAWDGAGRLLEDYHANAILKTIGLTWGSQKPVIVNG